MLFKYLLFNHNILYLDVYFVKYSSFNMLTIKCSKCRNKLLKYRKIGKGRVLRCWYGRIVEDKTLRSGDTVLCECGNVIGTADAKKIRMRQSSFTSSGSYE